MASKDKGNEPIEPIIHKLSEAVSSPDDTAEHPKLGQPVSDNIDIKQHNAEVRRSRTDRLVDVGRAHDTTGRGDPRDQRD